MNIHHRDQYFMWFKIDQQRHFFVPSDTAHNMAQWLCLTSGQRTETLEYMNTYAGRSITVETFSTQQQVNKELTTFWCHRSSNLCNFLCVMNLKYRHVVAGIYNYQMPIPILLRWFGSGQRPRRKAPGLRATYICIATYSCTCGEFGEDERSQEDHFSSCY